MKTATKIVAFLLAGLMVLGTMGTLLAKLAFASTGATARYTVNRVYGRGGDVTYQRGDSSPIQIGDGRGRPGYSVDISITVTDPDASLSDIASGGQNLIQPATGLGDFSFASDSTYTVSGQKAAQDGGVTYTVNLTKVRYSGVGSSLDLTMESKSGNTYRCSVSLDIAETVPGSAQDYDKNEPDDSTIEYDEETGKPITTPIDVATPYVIVSKYTYGGSQIEAGQTFSLTLTLFNTSYNIDVENMMVTITMPDDLMLTSSSNTFYIDSLLAGDTVTKTVQVTAKPAAKAQSHNIGVAMKYQYLDWKVRTRKDSGTEETIAIPVVQVDRFQLTGLESDMEFVVGQEGYLSINYVNKGRSEVYNISGEIAGNIKNPGQNQNVGNLASGGTGSMDFYVIPNEEGLCTGEVIITYEDTNNREQRVTMPFSVQAVDYNSGGDMGPLDPGMSPWEPGMEPGMEEPKKPVWPFVAGAAGVITIVVVAVVVKKRMNKKRSEALDAEL